MPVFKPTGSQFFVYDFRFKGRRYNGPTGAKTARKAKEVETAKREAVGIDWARAADGQAPARPKGQVPTLDEAAKSWWTALGQAKGRPHDEDFRLSRLERAVVLVGKGLLVTQIRTDDIDRAIQKRRGVLVKPPGAKGPGHVPANATVNRDIIETIRPVINHACAKLDTHSPPIAWGKLRMATPKPRARDFAPEGVEAFYAALPEHWREFSRFEARYGLRVAEMFFHPGEVTIGARNILTLLDRKGGDDHVLPLLPADAAMLAGRKSRAEAAGLDTVWYRQLKGGRIKALRRNSAVWAIRMALRKSGLRGAKGTHDLRHHAAMTALRASNGNLRVVQKLLGHSDIKSTMVYAHALEGDVLSALEAVEAQGFHKAGLSGSENHRENKAVAG